MNPHLMEKLNQAVVVWANRFQQNGGIRDTDIARVSRYAQHIATGSDHFVFGEADEETASIFNEMSEAIAVLAHLPGGLSFGGFHYESSSGQFQIDAIPLPKPRKPSQ